MNFLVNIDVDDLDKALHFYGAVFGLQPGRRFDFGVEMLGGPSPIFLLMKQQESSPSKHTLQMRRYQRHWTPLHLDFVVDDIDSAVARAVREGGQMEAAISTHEWGKLALMADPFGHGFCFVQFLGRGYDAVAQDLPPLTISS